MMENNRQIEDMLKECWNPEPPRGMRERVLRRGRRELGRRNTRSLVVSRWKFALICVGILIVLATNVSDYARQNRLSATTGLSKSVSSCTVTDRNPVLGPHELDKLIAELDNDNFNYNN